MRRIQEHRGFYLAAHCYAFASLWEAVLNETVDSVGEHLLAVLRRLPRLCFVGETEPLDPWTNTLRQLGISRRSVRITPKADVFRPRSPIPNRPTEKMPGRGLEPLRIAPPDPKSGASANFATPA